MQRDYIEVNSEVEKLYLNNHQLKSVSLSSLEIGFWSNLCVGEPQPECKIFNAIIASAVVSIKLWRRNLGIKNKTYLDWFVPYNCSLTIHQSHGYFLFLVYVKHICTSGPLHMLFSPQRIPLSLHVSPLQPPHLTLVPSLAEPLLKISLGWIQPVIGHPVWRDLSASWVSCLLVRGDIAWVRLDDWEEPGKTGRYQTRTIPT